MNSDEEQLWPKIKKRLWPITKEFLLPILFAIILWWGFNNFVLKVVRVSGPSMEPNLQSNERVLVFPLAQIKHLSVIVFDANGEDPQAVVKNDYYVKRVIGLPGDTVSFNNGKLYVDNKLVDQSFISESERTAGTGLTATQQSGNWDLQKLAAHWPKNKTAVKVPAGEYFVLGDHRSVSNDSRYWGFVPKDKILGVVKTLPWGTSSTEKRNINSLGY